jgi:MFS family permease
VQRVRLLLGISIFWLALSMIFDGINSLVLPQRLLGLVDDASKATMLGLLSFVGLIVGMLVQPLAGAFSDRVRPRWGRRGSLALGVLVLLPSLALFGLSRRVLAVVVGYVLIQVAASVAQAAQQGFLPDLVATGWRGTAAGVKLFMDLGGALLGFIVLGQLLGAGQTTPALLTIGGVVVVTFLLTVALVREPSQAAVPGSGRVTLVDAFQLDLRRHRAFVWLVASRFLFLLGTYIVGRFLLFFVTDRLGLDPGRATKEAGSLLAALTLLTVALSLPAGWAADRLGRVPLMLAGAVVSALGALLLIVAGSTAHILLFGGLMAVGSAAFAGANWALIADLSPPAEAGRFYGLANVGTGGAAAAAGLVGPVVDWANGITPGAGYTALFVASALAFLASALALRRIAMPSELPAAPGGSYEAGQGLGSSRS